MSGVENQGIDKDHISNEMGNIITETLTKHLMGRIFDEDKVKKWGNIIIDEIHKELSNKYPEYGYCTFFYISDKTGFVSNFDTVYFIETDIKITISYHTDGFQSEIRMIATKIHGQINNFLNIAKDKELSSSIEQKLSDHLEGRTYDYELFNKLLDIICDDINNILLANGPKCCSMHVGYISKHPEKDIYFYYKFFNLKLYPILFNYKNDSFTCRIYLFLINN